MVMPPAAVEPCVKIQVGNRPAVRPHAWRSAGWEQVIGVAETRVLGLRVCRIRAPPTGNKGRGEQGAETKTEGPQKWTGTTKKKEKNAGTREKCRGAQAQTMSSGMGQGSRERPDDEVARGKWGRACGSRNGTTIGFRARRRLPAPGTLTRR